MASRAAGVSGGTVAAHVQEAMARVLLLRPEKPAEFLAEYFRTAAALESLPSATAAAPVLQLSGFGASTPLSRALLLLHTAADARLHAPEAWKRNLLAAFDELAAGGAGAFPENGLLGCLLLQPPGPQRGKQQRAGLGAPAVQVRSALATKLAGATTDDAAAVSAVTGVDVHDLKLLLQRLVDGPAADQSAVLHVPMPPDLARAVVSALVEDAISEVRVQSEGSARDAGPKPIAFEAFTRAVETQQRLCRLYRALTSLLLVALPPPTSAATSGDAVLLHLQTAVLPLADAQELLRMLLLQSAATPAVVITEQQAVALLTSFQSAAAAAVRHNSSATPRGSAAAVAAAHRERDAAAASSSLTPMTFIRALVQCRLDDLAAAREARMAEATARAARESKAAQEQSSQQRSSFDSDAAAGAMSFDATQRNLAHMVPPRRNPLRRGEASPFEHVESAEYG